MVITGTKIQHYSLISTTIGDFRVDIYGFVEFDQEIHHGYCQFVPVHPDNIVDFGLTREDYINLQHTGIDAIIEN